MNARKEGERRGKIPSIQNKMADVFFRLSYKSFTIRSAALEADALPLGQRGGHTKQKLTLVVKVSRTSAGVEKKAVSRTSRKDVCKPGQISPDFVCLVD